MKLPSCVVAAAFAATTFFLVAPAHAEGDPQEGAEAFRRCAVCHTVEEGGANKIGPNLWGVVGSVSGTRETGFRYSQALRDAAVTWDDAVLDRWIENPRQLIAGTRMAFPGLRDAQEREDIIAYLLQSTR